MKKEIIGEILGTLILVSIGCGSVAVAVLYNCLTLWQVALIWGTGVALAIYATSRYSKSHLNPAVSFGFYLQKQISLQQLFVYSIAQIIGGVAGGLIVYSIFHQDILQFEIDNNILSRANSNAKYSAQMFGEFFPNPGFEKTISISHLGAFLYELIGTFFLFVIIQIAILPLFSKKNISPLIIGLGLAGLIIWIAPYTQAGFNPARDLGPRIFAYIKGWKGEALTQPWYGIFTVYVIAPVIGAALAAIGTRNWNQN